MQAQQVIGQPGGHTRTGALHYPAFPPRTTLADVTLLLHGVPAFQLTLDLNQPCKIDSR